MTAAALTAAAVLQLAGAYTDWNPDWVRWQVFDAGTGHGESSGRPDVVNEAGPWYGLMQIGAPEGRQYGATPEQLLDPATNIRVAHALWQARGTQPWPSAVKYPGKAVASVNYPPDEHAPVISWLKASRPSGCTPKLIIVHATRGGNRQANQYAATKSWFNSTGNGSAAQGWGGCATHLISHEGQRCSFMNEVSEVPRYSAGYGSNLPPLGWCADDWGVSFELAQSDQQESFAAATIERMAMEAARCCQTYGINPVHLGPIDQRGPAPTVSGIVGHDELENGRKLGKSDPGAQFPWPAFMAKVNYYMGGQLSAPIGQLEAGMANLNTDGSQKVVSEGNFIVFYNNNVPVQRIGSTDGQYPGRISKNFGGNWLWQRALDDKGNLVPVYMSPVEGD